MHNEISDEKSMQRRSGVSPRIEWRTALMTLGGSPVRRGAGKQVIAGVLAASMFPCSLASALGQEYGAPPPPDAGYGAPLSGYQPQGPEQLDQLVAPIALYPDSLVAQVLAAATYPAQVASAQQFLAQNSGYPPEQLAELANTQPWDPSVKALVAFPQVVNTLNQNMDWTTQLGNAYFNQPQDVLGAVQAMRQRAYAAGSLRPTQQLAVDYAPGAIVIAPVNPAVVYVPYYNPWVVYGAPVPVYGHYYYGGPPRGVVFGAGLAIGFGVGLAIGAFTHFSWGFHSWAPNWGSRTVVFNHNTYISNSVTVINHGNYGRYDRAPEARAFNQQQAARFSNVGNHTTINNVTVNRGGNTFNNGGNTYNRGGNTFNNGGNTNYNRNGSTFNNGGNTVNRDVSPYANGANTVNRGGAYNNGAGAGYRGAQPTPGAGVYNRPAQQPTPGAQPNPGAYNRYPAQSQGGYGQQARPQQQAQFNPQQAGAARPQQQYSQRPQGGAPQQAARPQQQQQRSAPQQQNHGNGNENRHEDHGGGGHEERR